MNTFLHHIYEISNKSKYIKWYVNLISSRLDRINYSLTKKKIKLNLLEMHECIELHHILPKCMCTKNESNNKENLVALTPKEHFIAHLLLTKIFEDITLATKMRFAVSKFMQSNNHQQRVLTSNSYNLMRINLKNALKTVNNNRKYTPLSEETKSKISYSIKNSPHYNAWSIKRKKHTLETRLKLKNAWKNDQRRLDASLKFKETRENNKDVFLSSAIKNLENFIKGIRVSCIYCKKSCDVGNFYNHHGDFCKHNPNKLVKKNVTEECVFCKKEVNKNRIHIFHNENCKKNPNRPNRAKPKKQMTCEVCGKTMSTQNFIKYGHGTECGSRNRP